MFHFYQLRVDPLLALGVDVRVFELVYPPPGFVFGELVLDLHVIDVDCRIILFALLNAVFSLGDVGFGWGDTDPIVVLM